MPQIFDNIELELLPTLQKAMEVSQRADFCVGYFNLRGWKDLDQYVQSWPGGFAMVCLRSLWMAKQKYLAKD